MMNINEIMETIEGWYMKNDKIMSSFTLRTYRSRLNNIFKKLNIQNISTFKNSKLILDKLKKLYSNISTYKTSISAILILIQSYNLDEELILEYRKVLLGQTLLYQENQKEKIKIVNDELLSKYDFQKIRKRLFNKKLEINKKNILKQFVYLLYTCNPPVRNDYNIMKIKKDNEEMKKEYNYFDVKNGIFLF